jgi:riboflavin kinase / FMN adenylyltransferase
MEVLDSLKKIKNTGRGIAITIGNFDGVHLGHQSLLLDIIKLCNDKNEDLIVCTFTPHPKFILANASNFLINSYEERRSLLNKMGIEILVEFEFTRDFSTLSPKAFLDNFIAVIPNLNSLYLGHDFAFGANKSGDHAFVKKYCSDNNISCILENEFIPETSIKASSTSIRKLLSAGSIHDANLLLGRPFFVQGRVIKGMGRGKTIGFPTANIIFSDDRIVPKVGVYKSSVTVNHMTYESITNVGYNPTFENNKKINFETHIFDFDNDIYGEELLVEMHQFIRNEIKFNNVNELIKQIKADIKAIRE